MLLTSKLISSETYDFPDDRPLLDDWGFDMGQVAPEKKSFSGQKFVGTISKACMSGKFVRKWSMFLGYGRVSTADQDLALQRDALTAAGCERIFTDEGLSELTTRRPSLDAAIAGPVAAIQRTDCHMIVSPPRA